MRLTRIDGGCDGGTCPTVYATDRGTFVVQGYVISDPQALRQLDLPEGENAVEIPAELLRSVARAVTG
ncbi:hypothetical protein TH66_17765 [Carbonactinospora thermoautotrophica]|uniref:Uncharacterized protein n=1 Tax=Carbonactinospora thermoautotrophica TaxID=1469144 RepID=A0A132NAK7_9ACTN|nr:hypothetical protein TH66_17765 [Carbonactinospora thermoautotrophica]KWX07114.1 hypothetical protein TR74_19865 [Carbonactinospora thermoautotrophica]